MRTLTKAQARRFLLLKQGLLGPYRFVGKQGALDYARQAGCLQFGPVDVCGKNAELTLQSRVRGFKKRHLSELLYRDRALFDYPDKEMSIVPTETWPYFQRWRERSLEHGKGFAELQAFCDDVLAYIRENGPVNSSQLPIRGKTYWHSSMHWSGNWEGKSDVARSALEQLYSEGRLIIHHKEGSRKFYDLAERYLDADLLCAPDPCPETWRHAEWAVLRRVGAVGLLWNRRSDAFLGLWDRDPETRSQAFEALLKRGELRELHVEGIKESLYYQAGDEPLLEAACGQEAFRKRCEFLAPLDPFLWDRRLIGAIFDFQYSWEIYTPPAKLKYGHYVLPVLYGERLIGRIEPVVSRQERVLQVKNMWLEPDIRVSKGMQKAVGNAVQRLATFNDCEDIRAPERHSAFEA